LYGAFVWARRALNRQKWRFPVWVVVEAIFSGSGGGALEWGQFEAWYDASPSFSGWLGRTGTTLALVVQQLRGPKELIEVTKTAQLELEEQMADDRAEQQQRADFALDTAPIGGGGASGSFDLAGGGGVGGVGSGGSGGTQTWKGPRNTDVVPAAASPRRRAPAIGGGRGGVGESGGSADDPAMVRLKAFELEREVNCSPTHLQWSAIVSRYVAFYRSATASGSAGRVSARSGWTGRVPVAPADRRTRPRPRMRRRHPMGRASAAAALGVGLSRIVALHHRSSTSYHIH
jgi:hypothetical protein